MNTKGKAKQNLTQKDISKDIRTNIITVSNPFGSIHVQPYPKPNKFQLNIASKKYYHKTKLSGKGFSGRQYSSSYLQIIPKPKTRCVKAIIDIRDHSRDKSIELLEQKYLQALNQVKEINTARGSSMGYGRKVATNTYVSKSPINNQIKMNTEILKKKTQPFINKRMVNNNRSPCRPSTPDYCKTKGNQVTKEQRRNQKTPDCYSKKMSYYMPSTNNLTSKLPSRNIKNYNGNNSHLYRHTNTNVNAKAIEKINYMNTPTERDAFSHYQYSTTQTKENNPSQNKLSNHNDNNMTTTNALRDNKKYSFANPSFHNSSSQKSIKMQKPTSSLSKTNNGNDQNRNENNPSNHSCINYNPKKDEENLDSSNQFLYLKINYNNKQRQAKTDSIRLSKANNKIKESQSRKTIQSTFILPDEEQIDFNELDQFSPPHVGSFNFKEKVISPAESTIYTTIEMINQEKQSSGTIPASSLPSSNNRQIIDNFIYKINSGNQKYSTLEYNHIITLNDFKRAKESNLKASP